MKKLFIIGNGFDREHNLSTAYNPHFKEIAERNEQISYFWDIYQSRGVDIWADFENCLAHPDFNSLEEIFDGFEQLNGHNSLKKLNSEFKAAISM